MELDERLGLVWDKDCEVELEVETLLRWKGINICVGPV